MTTFIMLLLILLLVVMMVIVESLFSFINIGLKKLSYMIDNTTDKYHQEIDDPESVVIESRLDSACYCMNDDNIYLRRLENKADYATYFHELTHKGQNKLMLELYHDPIFIMKSSSFKLLRIFKIILGFIVTPIKYMIQMIMEVHAFYGSMRLSKENGILSPKIVISGLICLLTYMNQLVVIIIEYYLFIKIFS